MSATHLSRPHSGPVLSVSASQAFAALQEQESALLVDVRTAGEWAQGAPSLPQGRKPLFISWRLAPSMELNSGFIDSLRTAIPSQDVPLYFLCKAGVRSEEAARAVAEAGYRHVHNIEGGFDGGPQNWVASALPVEKA